MQKEWDMQLNHELWDKSIEGLPVLVHVLASLKSYIGLISLKIYSDVEDKWLSLPSKSYFFFPNPI